MKSYMPPSAIPTEEEGRELHDMAEGQDGADVPHGHHVPDNAARIDPPQDIDCKGRSWNWFDLVIRTVGSRFGEAILTLGDFFGCLVCIIVVLHVYIAIGTIEPSGGCIFAMWLFALTTANIMLIPIWAFLKFSYFKDRACLWTCVLRTFYGPYPWPDKLCDDGVDEWWYRDLSHQQVDQPLQVTFEQDESRIKLTCSWCKKQFWPILETLFAIVFILFILSGLLSDFTKGIDGICMAVIVVMPLAKIGLLFLAYWWNFMASFISCKRCCGCCCDGDYEKDGDKYKSWRKIFWERQDKISDPFIFSLFGHQRLFGHSCDKSECCRPCDHPNPNIDDNSNESQKVPRGVRAIDVVWEVVHLGVPLGILIWLMSLVRESTDKHNISFWWGMVIAIVILLPLFQIRFPFFVFNYIVDCTCGNLVRRKEQLIEQKDFTAEMFLNPRVKSIRVISAGTFCLVLAVLMWITYKMKGVKGEPREYSPFPVKDNYKYTRPVPQPTQDETKEIVSQLCYVKPYGLKMIQMAALAAAAYNDFTSERTKFLFQEYFDETIDPNVNITDKGQMDLTKYKYNAAAYFQFDRLNLTVISVRGSTEDRDWALDTQLLLSSALFTLASPLSIFSTPLTTKTYKWIRSIIGWPLLMLKPISLTEKYMESFSEWFSTVRLNANVVFVGHSLGGALAKLYAYQNGRPAISFSGPGIKILEAVYHVKGQKGLERTLTGESEVVPDMDVVPRLEVSAGTRYRVLCDRDPGTCHKITPTLCMIGVMCETEHREFCTNITDPRIGDFYDKMVKLAREA